MAGEKNGSDEESDNSSVDMEEVDDAVENHQPSGDDIDDEEEEDSSNKPSESDALEKDAVTEANFEEEADVTRKVLKNFLASSKVNIASNDGETEESDKNKLEESSAKPVVESSGVSEPLKTKEVAPKETQEDDDFKRTVFISNIPFDVSKEEVTQRFAVFGQVESLFLVLHPVTKYASFLCFYNSFNHKKRWCFHICHSMCFLFLTDDQKGLHFSSSKQQMHQMQPSQQPVQPQVSVSFSKAGN